MNRKIVAYYRVSTTRQEASGLGLEAQRHAVSQYARSTGSMIVCQFTEVESGRINDRPKLLEAIEHCELTGARLVIAKLDRLSRNLAFIACMQESGIPFTCCDMPDANETLVSFMAVMAQAERKAISERTRQALQAAKAKGVRLGGPNLAKAREVARRNGADIKARAAQSAAAKVWNSKIQKVLASAFPSGGVPFRAYAEYLNEMGISTRRGNKWTPSGVRRVVLSN